MLKFMQILRSEVKDGEGGGAGTKPEAKPAEKPAESNPPVKAEGDNVDDFGYEKVAKEEGDKKPEGKAESKPEPKKADDKIENPATGYGEEEPKVEIPPKKEAAPEKIDLGYELKLEGFEPADALKVQQFAKKYSLSEKAAQEYANDHKADIERFKAEEADYIKQVEADKSKLRSEWHKELRVDPAFGGEKFAANIQRAEKVMEEFMPNTKKALTERKAMLPPYVMRDLAKLGDHLYSTEKMVNGEPAKPEEKKSDDPNAFLNELYQ